MQLGDALCYALLTITMAATCVQAEIESIEGKERKLDRRTNRRVSTLFVEGTPLESLLENPSKVIYRRLTRKRHAPPKPSYGPPRSKYGPPLRIHGRKPEKKYRGKMSTKRAPPNHHSKRAPKPRYGPPKRKPKPMYGPPKRKPKPTYGPPKNSYLPDNSGFAEPPTSFPYQHRPPKTNTYFSDFNNDSPKEGYESFESDFSLKPNIGHEFSSPASYYFQDKPFGENFPVDTQLNDYQNPKQNYGEPPVDSYGAPIKPNLHDLTFSTAHSSLESTSLLNDNYNFVSDPVPNYSKKQTRFSHPDEVFVTPVPEDQNAELALNSYSDIYNYRETKNKKKNKGGFYENIKILNRPWTSKINDNSDDEIIVGGQYAEPPARHIPKFLPSASTHIRENYDSVFSPPLSFSDPDAISSATISSYVNYKNSNMAFSPQNLNDVFSIVDK